MNIYRRYHTVSHVSVLLGILTFCVADVHPGLALIAGVLIAGSWMLFRDTVVSPLPRWALNLLLLAATANMFRAAFASRLALQDDAIAILAEYLIYLQLIKLFESRTPRDQAQLLVLNVMLVIGAVLTSITLQVGVMLAIYAPTFLATVLLFQLFAGQHRAAAPRNKPAESALAMTACATGSLPRDLRRVTAIALVLIGAVATLVFLLMPRSIGDDVIGRWPRAAAGASSGFSDSVQLGGEGLISESRDVVLEFDLYLNDQKITTELNKYLRGTVLDEYDIARGSWNRSSRLQALDKRASCLLRPGDSERGFRQLPQPTSEDTAWVQVVTVRNKTTEHLFALWRPVQVACESPNDIYLNVEDKTLRMPGRGGMLTYTVRSIKAPDSPAPEPDERPEPDDRFARPRRAVPANPFLGSFIETYARSIIERAGLERTDDGHADQRILQLFERHLRDDFTYTLNLVAPPPGVEPLEAFLTTTRSGNCEYFASAMVAMAQAIGIPSRIVTGYVTNEVDPVTGSYVVRKSHAHAWVEARVEIVTDDPADGQLTPEWIPTWRTFDPTPPSELRALNQPPTGIIGWAQRALDRAQQLWIKGIIAFNADRQHEVLEQTGVTSLGIDSLSRIFDAIPGAPVRKLVQFTATALISFLVLIFGLFFLRNMLTWSSTRAVRRVHRWWISRSDPAAASRLRHLDIYDRMLRTLARAGFPKPASLPPLAFARSLRERSPDIASRVERLALLYYAVRFGHNPLTPGALDDAELQLRALRDELRNRQPTT